MQAFLMMHLTLLDLADLVGPQRLSQVVPVALLDLALGLGFLALVAPGALEVPQLCCSFLVVLVVLVDLVDRGPPLAVLCPPALALGKV